MAIYNNDNSVINLENFLYKLERGERFSIIRPGDGELHIIKNNPLKTQDNWSYKKDGILSKDLLFMNSCADMDDFYIGLPCPDCFTNGYSDYINLFNSIKVKNLTYANIFCNKNWNTFIQFLIEKKLPFYFIGSRNENGNEDENRDGDDNGKGKNTDSHKLKLNILDSFYIESDLVNNWDDKREDVIRNITIWVNSKMINADVERGPIFLFSAGPISKVLIPLFHKNPLFQRASFIDVGSTIDYFTKGASNRFYANNDPYYSNLICSFSRGHNLYEREDFSSDIIKSYPAETLQKIFQLYLLNWKRVFKIREIRSSFSSSHELNSNFHISSSESTHPVYHNSHKLYELLSRYSNDIEYYYQVDKDDRSSIGGKSSGEEIVTYRIRKSGNFQGTDSGNTYYVYDKQDSYNEGSKHYDLLILSSYRKNFINLSSINPDTLIIYINPENNLHYNIYTGSELLKSAEDISARKIKEIEDEKRREDDNTNTNTNTNTNMKKTEVKEDEKRKKIEEIEEDDEGEKERKKERKKEVEVHIDKNRREENGITAVLNFYKRPHTLLQQIRAIKAQTVKPEKIIIWKNKCEGIEIPEDAMKEIINDKDITLIDCSENLGVWPRFAAALLAKTKYVCVFDDDTIPGCRWFRNCLNTMKKVNGLLGTVGIIFDPYGESYFDHYGDRRIGWTDHNEEITEVDIVGHSWFFKREWIHQLWSVVPDYNILFKTGEDMGFSWALQKIGIKTYVPPHPKNDIELFGSVPYLGLKYGSEKGCISCPSSGTDFEVMYRYYLDRGFKLLKKREEEEYEEKRKEFINYIFKASRKSKSKLGKYTKI